MLTHLDRLRAFVATLNPPFGATASVTLSGLNPNRPEGQWAIEQASAWAANRAERRGLSSRRVNAADHEVTWKFEYAADAVEFRLGFGCGD